MTKTYLSRFYRHCEILLPKQKLQNRGNLHSCCHYARCILDSNETRGNPK
ncbi:hypothetical protein [Helicobacter sp. T3_23-1059]